ncbi:uncharacterized protein LOC125304619 [Alosa alosa]|uniref:uncharacterized protein LOC125304619 n=1 Tax=Alosa alosa TaxID=278164 RepID=UPI002015526D|nr:uncharacterized protein LOC125304619 [Alosa alosa]
MQLQIFQYDTFRRHARNYMEPAIVHKWKMDQQSHFQHQLHLGGVVAVGGDMRADSPGHSAKFGSYTLMNLESNTIMDIQLVQSNEVGGSYHMEKEGLKRCLDHLESNGLKVDYIVTDRHPQIQKFLRERSVTQFYDVWHFEKGSVALHKAEKILLNKRVLKDVEKLSHHHQTSSLESFHSLILRFAPKNVVFPFMGMLCRLYLAAMHHNEHALREQATTSTGQAVFKVVFPKAKRGEGIVKPVKTNPTFNYVRELMRLLMQEVFEDPTSFAEELKTIPIPPDLSAEFPKTPKAELVARHVSRFNQ